MEVARLAIQSLFEKNVLYSVPLYQRPYVWKKDEQWQPLWEDLRRLTEVLLNGKQPRSHFLGATVQVVPPVPPGQIETRLLIDGQQRLTTLQLLLRAFEDVVSLEGDTRYRKAIGKLIRNEHPLSTKDSENFKIWPTNADRKDYRTVMETSDRKAILKFYGVRSNAEAVGRNIPDAYLFFQDVISKWLSKDDGFSKQKKIETLYSAIRDNVRLVVIDLDGMDDAQLIFETLNARGTPLLSADLVKNSLLSEIQSNGDDVDKVYQKYWQPFDNDAHFWRKEIGSGHASRARIEIFLKHALTLLTGDDVAAAHLYRAYHDFSRGADAGTALDRIQDIKKYGEIYRELMKGHEEPRINLFLERLKVMDVGTAYPFLLKLFDELGNRVDLLTKVIEDIESFLVRRMVCRLSTRGYSSLFVDLVRTVSSEAEDIPCRVREDLAARTADSDRWPKDTEFMKAWMSNPLFKKITRPRLRLLLEGLEAGLRSDFAETNNVPRDLTIEHIMPQNWEENWPLIGVGPAADEKLHRDELIHTIGNLSLLSKKLNPLQSNKAWVVPNDADGGKREALKSHSVLHLNKELCDHDLWNEDTIHARSEQLFKIAKMIWRAPPVL